MDEAAVKVFVRFRPVNAREANESGGLGPGDALAVGEDDVRLTMKGKENAFAYDRVFGATSRQVDVYEAVASGAIADVLNGFHATVFAYGQTGAGKSFTMFGGPDEASGIIPRAARHIFDHIANSPEAREWSVKASFLEIYREQLRDLLNPSNSKLQIREQKKKIWVENLSEEFCGAAEDVMELISSGEKLRATSSTAMNETSSRSHSVLIVKIESKPETPSGAPARCAVLNLIDLAGSERVGKTGATGTTLKEAQKINQSLSALGNVINALSSGSAEHVPYRDSQLTRLLQESLGGNCKTRLIVACSPHGFNFEETLSSLRFGARAKTLKNRIHKNEERSVEELKALIKELRAELEEWRAYAANVKSGVAAEAPKAFDRKEQAAVSKARVEEEQSLAAELEKLGEALQQAEAARRDLADRCAELEARLKLQSEEAERRQLEFDGTERRLAAEVERLQIQVRVDRESGGAAPGDHSAFTREIEALTERLAQLRADAGAAAAGQRRAEEAAAATEERLRHSVPLEEHQLVVDELAQLRAWRDSQAARKGRLFRPLKSGGKGPPPAMAEKLDHTELRKGLRSVSASAGKKLW